ncbi:MAG: hypothetical protein E7378_02145 [Clostridiales bacterium]|nr:hypothetical protein [Clostridiales bacterium]
MILANLWTDFCNLFTQMHWIVVVLLVLGFILCIIEAVVPGFGIFGILGILCEVGAIVVHAVFSGSVAQVFFLVLIVALVILLLFLIFVRSAKYGLLAKSAIAENKTALPKDFKDKAEKELSALVGKEGLAITECRPVGKIRIEQETYEAQSIGTVIKKGEVIRVVSIEDARIMIDRLIY